MDELYTKLKTYGKVRTDEPLSKHTTFKIGGPADFFVIVEDVGVLGELLSHLDGAGVRYMILGGGSNMLVSDDGFDGVVIKVKSNKKEVQGDVVVADAGCITVAVAQFAMQNKLTGFEWGVGVPGTIGGAVRGNAGAMGGEMSDSVKKIEVYRDGEVIELSHAECDFDYRTSGIKKDGGVVLRVWLQLESGGDAGGMKKALEHLQYRNKTQPQGYASTGCIFKNPDTEKNKSQLLKHFDEQDEKVQQFLRVGKISAGWLVEQAGLKGLKIGNAQVSEVHGNFVVNLGDAKAVDVLSIIDKIKETVYNMFEIEMHEEIHIIH